MNKKSIQCRAIAVALSFVIFYGCHEKEKMPPQEASSTWQQLFADLEFEMDVINPPVFKDYEVNISSYGAIADGKTLCTEAITKAIDEVAKKGGGKVIIPSGIWYTGPIQLKSNVNLHVESGAVLLFSDDFQLYPIIGTSFEGLETFRCQSPISAYKQKNIAITGKGIIDGNGDAWRPVKQSKMTSSQWHSLLARGGVLNEAGNIWYPTEKSKKGAELSSMNVPALNTKEDHEAVKDFLRPVMISLVECEDVMLDGPTFQNSPAWNIHPLMCENLILRNLTVKNPWYSQNGDGVDVESCKNTVIYNCSFDVGDDAICIKSGKDADGRKRGMPTENLVVKNNVVYHGHGGFVIGSEMSGGVKNAHVSHCTFLGTDVGLRFKSTRGRGGVVENIYISDIDMLNIPTEAIRFNMYYTGNSPVPEAEQEQVDVEALQALMKPVTEETPQFRNIFVKNVICKNAGQAIKLQGLPEMNLSNVSIENVKMSAQKGISCTDADGIKLSGIWLSTNEEIPVNIMNSKHVELSDISFENVHDMYMRVVGPFSNEIKVGQASWTKEQVYTAENVKKGSIIF